MKTLDEARALQDCGRLIRKARKEKGWTQAQLADAIGVKRSVVSKYENGLIELSISKLSTIEYVLGIKFNEQESTINTLRDAIYEDAAAHGLWEEESGPIECCVLIGDEGEGPIKCYKLISDEVEELGSAAVSWETDYFEDCDDNGFSEELSDVIIMCLSVAGKLGIDIDDAVRRKMEINKARPWKHGK